MKRFYVLLILPSLGLGTRLSHLTKINSNYDVIRNRIRNKVNEKFYICHDISSKIIKIIGLDNDVLRKYEDKLDYGEFSYYVNWEVCSKQKMNMDAFRYLWPENLKFSKGLGDILKANGVAIENANHLTGLEAFMLAAVGANSQLEIVQKLLEDYLSAIIPHVRKNHQPPVSFTSKWCYN